MSVLMYVNDGPLHQSPPILHHAYLSKIPHLDKSKPNHELLSLLFECVSKVYQDSKHSTLCRNEELVGNKTFNLPSKVPDTKQVFAIKL